MHTHFQFAPKCIIALFSIVIGFGSLSAQEENSLALCLHGVDEQSRVCEIECQMEACGRAAKEGHAKAILLFGMAHVYGKGVPQDYVTAYMYFQVLYKISDTFDENQRYEAKEYSQRLMEELRERMARDDVSRAESLARQWIDENL